MLCCRPGHHAKTRYLAWFQIGECRGCREPALPRKLKGRKKKKTRGGGTQGRAAVPRHFALSLVTVLCYYQTLTAGIRGSVVRCRRDDDTATEATIEFQQRTCKVSKGAVTSGVLWLKEHIASEVLSWEIRRGQGGIFRQVEKRNPTRPPTLRLKGLNLLQNARIIRLSAILQRLAGYQ
jgi:hypothetical protein